MVHGLLQLRESKHRFYKGQGNIELECVSKIKELRKYGVNLAFIKGTRCCLVEQYSPREECWNMSEKRGVGISRSLLPEQPMIVY